jgi:outer membrane protein assembly factor BamA
LQAALTDVLGNHQYYFLIYNTADTRTDIINSINVGVTYLNQKKRLNWGLGLYRFYNEYNDDYYGFVNEETYGGLAVASYPFSRYDRFESSIYLRKYYKQTLRDVNPDAVVGTGIISYIKDTSIWDPSGPIDGFRAHLTIASSIDIRSAKYYNSWINVDVRKYFRLSEASAYALRAVYFTSRGQDPQRYYIGGSWDLRGYPRRSFYGRNVFLLNNELRFPLVDRLYIGFPFGSINFQAIRGALFFDVGKAWEDKAGNLAGSFGFGIRVSLGYVTVLRFDFARRTDFRSIENGFKFDFFFGWNY